ncbi:MAG: tripartite tricarboxylate transporter substrate binding protein [Proteobacteria bacterium]|nr:tripartite tricarboxylate transporter substrate binding protein [Pseudomonadota bacterium]
MKAAVLAALLAVACSAAAQYPNKPIHIVVPYQAGGTSEVMARAVGDHLAGAWKQPVVIENKPGGGTTIGAAAVAQAPADGYTLFVNAASYLINAQLMSKLPYDPAKDFMPVTLAASNPHVLVVFPGLGITNLKDFLSVAKARGKSMSYASFGNGSSGHLAFELFKKSYAFDMVHVPYKGVPQAMTDVMGGQVQAMLTDLLAAVPQVKSGKLAGLAVAAERRTPTLPDLPTFEEASGTKFVSRSWFGILVRTGTPPEIHRMLAQEIARALHRQDVKDKLLGLGMDTYGTSPDEFAAFMKGESDRYADAIRFSGTKIE